MIAVPSPLDLGEVHQRFIRNLNLFPVLGIELEFYVEGEDVPHFIELLRQECSPDNELIPVEAIKSETGLNQYEAEFGPTLEVEELAHVVQRFRDYAVLFGDRHGYIVKFESKPYADQPSCGMHVHCSVVDGEGQNSFIRQAGEESPLLIHAIGGLLELLPASMKYFAPLASCYTRYQKSGTLHAGKKNIETPHTISWGGNNRTVAIRIPESSLQEETRRLEHRVPSVEAKVDQVVAVILVGVEYGMSHKIVPSSPKVYGYAFEAQYNPVWLPQSLEEARGYSHKVLTQGD